MQSLTNNLIPTCAICTSALTHRDYHMPGGFFRARVSRELDPDKNPFRAENVEVCSLLLIFRQLDPGKNPFRAENAAVCGRRIASTVFGRVESSPAFVSQAKPAFGQKRVLANTRPKPLLSIGLRSSSPGNAPVVDLAMPPASGSARDTAKSEGQKVAQGRRGSGLQTSDTSHADSGSVGSGW